MFNRTVSQNPNRYARLGTLGIGEFMAAMIRRRQEEAATGKSPPDQRQPLRRMVLLCRPEDPCSECRPPQWFGF